MASGLPQLDRYQALAFDLDGTLYPSLPGLDAQFELSLKKTVKQVTACSENDVDRTLGALRRQHRHVVQGLAKLSGLDTTVLLEDIYRRLDLSGIRENPRLHSTLDALSGGLEILVLTNSSKGHADRVLSLLGLHDIPIQVYGMEEAQFHLKPDRFVYLNVLSSKKLKASRVLYFDDSQSNIAAARELGVPTVHVREGSIAGDVADYQAEMDESAWTTSNVEEFLRQSLSSRIGL
ncbi:HAD-IA family hydrolase [Amycolatopsis magusensis]|uniref:HAD-IA family hydrolase n=1 Tax=Amycolatopsis magusensis TaxID=882444 RepID=UPI0024A82363|nr:HAD-IA family hydrolase [Amycolatopsis magusensis]MDI5982532.1 HAD-IA family hydrolase [Amycolatopsis magusensis]